MTPSAILVASAYRWSTAASTSSCEGADRVVSRIAHELAPCHPQHHLGVVLGCEEQSRQRFRKPLEGPLGTRAGLLDIHPVGRNAHQQVRPRSRAELAHKARQPGAGSPRECFGQRGDHYLETVLDRVGLCHDAAQPGLRLFMVRPVREQDRRVRPDRQTRAFLLESFEAAHECFWVVAHRGAG